MIERNKKYEENRRKKRYKKIITIKNELSDRVKKISSKYKSNGGFSGFVEEKIIKEEGEEYGGEEEEKRRSKKV